MRNQAWNQIQYTNYASKDIPHTVNSDTYDIDDTIQSRFH